MGLPNSGKTHLASRLAKILGYKHINADRVRKNADDWDFSLEGRLRQAKRMATLSVEGNCVVDFVCPTEETRTLFNADFIVWMDTISSSRYADTNNIFVPPTSYDVRVSTKDDCWVATVREQIRKHEA